MTKVATYSRVSTEEQDVKQQRDYLRKYCKNNEYTIVRELYEKQSGRKPLEERKEFLKLLKLSKSGKIDKVIIYNIDRLTRDFYNGIEIEKHFRDIWEFCKLESVTLPIDLSKAQGRMSFRMMLIMSCYFVEDSKEKSQIGIERAKAEGKYKGRKKGAKNKK